MAGRSKKKATSGIRNGSRPNGKAWSKKKYPDGPSQELLSKSQSDHDRTQRQKDKKKDGRSSD